MKRVGKRVVLGGALILGVLISGGRLQASSTSQTVLIAYARDFKLYYLVGQYDPHTKKWLSNEKSFTPPAALTPFTLLGARGKLADVHILYKALPNSPSWGWGADISSWSSLGITHALALSEKWDSPLRTLEALPLDDPESVAAVVAYLKDQHQDVPQPRLTEIYRIDLNGDGQQETVICANTDRRVLVDTAPAVVYTLALLRHTVNGKAVTDPLRTAVSFKPSNRSVDEHERLYGATGLYKVLAISDIAKDGHEQISILNDLGLGPEVELYHLQDAKPVQLLSMHPVYY